MNKLRYFCIHNPQLMSKKAAQYTSESDHINKTAQDISDALYQAIKNKKLPYDPATLARITRMDYDEGEFTQVYYLDYVDEENKGEAMVSVKLTKVYVDRFEVNYFQG